MNYPSLGRCSLVATVCSLVVCAVMVACWRLGGNWPFEVALLVYPGSVFFLAMPLHPTFDMVIMLWALALIANALIYILVGHIVFYVWRWRVRRSLPA